MPREAIKKIKEAEARAAEIKNAANESAHNNVITAHKAGEKLVSEMEKKARLEAEAKSKKTDEVISLMNEKAFRDRQDQSEKVKSNSAELFPKAVDFIFNSVISKEEN